MLGNSKLHQAASSGNADLLNSLLFNDHFLSYIGVNEKNYSGYTPLHLAASAGHANCVAELLNDDKTDIHVVDAFGRTPLETAEQYFKDDVAKLLRSHGKVLCTVRIFKYF